MITYKKLNRILREIDPTAELIKGNGYHYFVGNSVERAYTTSVMVNTLNSLSLDQWINEFLSLQKVSQGA